MVVFAAVLNATAFLLPPIYLILWYKVSFPTTGLLLLLCSCFELYPIFKGTLLASFLVVILAGVLPPSLELGSDDVHADELLPPFIRVFLQVLIVSHSVAEVVMALRYILRDPVDSEVVVHLSTVPQYLLDILPVPEDVQVVA